MSGPMSFAAKARSLVEDAALLLLLALLVPIGILVVGTPFALCVRVISALVRRL